MSTKVYVGSARSDEYGKAHGGAAGDQKQGREVSTQEWYKHAKGWRVFRAKDPAHAAIIARIMRWACNSALIGYDQYQRNTLYNELKKTGFSGEPKLSKPVETDCSALVRVCLAFCGIDVPADFYTGNMAAVMLATGMFVELTGSKYTDQEDYLAVGDVLVTKTKGHTVMVLTDGPKHKQINVPTGPVVKKGSWNVRKGPGTGYDSLGTVHGGDRLVTVDSDGWQAISWNGSIAYISKNAIEEG